MTKLFQIASNLNCLNYFRQLDTGKIEKRPKNSWDQSVFQLNKTFCLYFYMHGYNIIQITWVRQKSVWRCAGKQNNI